MFLYCLYHGCKYTCQTDAELEAHVHAMHAPRKAKAAAKKAAKAEASGGMPSDFLRELTQQKVVVFWEIAPNSDRFQQIMLNRTAMARVNTVLRMQMPLVPPKEREARHLPPGAFIVITNPNHAYKFPEIKDFYTDAEIQRYFDSGPDYSKP